MHLTSLILRCKIAWPTIFKCTQWCLISVVLNCDEKIMEDTKVTKILLSCRKVCALSLVLVQWDHILLKGSDLHTSDKRPEQAKKLTSEKRKLMQRILSYFNNKDGTRWEERKMLPGNKETVANKKVTKHVPTSTNKPINARHPGIWW